MPSQADRLPPHSYPPAPAVFPSTYMPVQHRQDRPAASFGFVRVAPLKLGTVGQLPLAPHLQPAETAPTHSQPRPLPDHNIPLSNTGFRPDNADLPRPRRQPHLH